MANIQVLYQFNFQVVYYVQFEEAENQTTIYVVCDTKLLQIFYFASDIVEILSKFNNKSCAIFLFIMAWKHHQKNVPSQIMNKSEQKPLRFANNYVYLQ